MVHITMFFAGQSDPEEGWSDPGVLRQDSTSFGIYVDACNLGFRL